MIDAGAFARWLSAAKDDVSFQASEGEPPPAPQGSPRPPDPLFGTISGWLAAPSAGMLGTARRGGPVPHGPPCGDTLPCPRSQGCSSGQGGRAAAAAKDGRCATRKPLANYQRRLEGRSGKKMIKTILLFFFVREKALGKSRVGSWHMNRVL